jgi:hypothetical protein
MKASGLIGLIVVVLFFLVHTFLGAIAPKKPANAPAADAGVTAPGSVAAPAAPGGGPAPAAADSVVPPGGGFPSAKAVEAHNGALAKSLEKDIPDPFEPINPKDKPGQQAAAPRQPDGNVSVWPSHDFSHGVGEVKPQYLRGGDLLPNIPAAAQGGPMLGAATQAGPAMIAVPRLDPEIAVVGLVDGEPPVATVRVGGKVTLAHRGDALATGYRVMEISPDGVVIRCGKDWKTLRVGDGMNQQPSAKTN